MKHNRVFSMLAVMVFVAFSVVSLTGMSWASEPVPPVQLRPVESIPARMSQERIRDEQAFAARSGVFSSTSDVLRDAQLGASEPIRYVSTSDVLRDQHLGGNAGASQSAPTGLHEERPGPMGRPSGR